MDFLPRGEMAFAPMSDPVLCAELVLKRFPNAAYFREQGDQIG
jgi:hypothetical protein